MTLPLLAIEAVLEANGKVPHLVATVRAERLKVEPPTITPPTKERADGQAHPR